MIKMPACICKGKDGSDSYSVTEGTFLSSFSLLGRQSRIAGRIVLYIALKSVSLNYMVLSCFWVEKPSVEKKTTHTSV